MARKEIAKAYIEGNRIKIVDSYGCEYEKEIRDSLVKAKRFGNHGSALMILSVCCFLFVLSHFIFLRQNEQMAVAAILGIILGLVSSDKFSEKEYLEDSIKDYLSEYNLAKHGLQDKVLELEKVLAQHSQDINELRLNNAMDFSENFKKKEKQTGYL